MLHDILLYTFIGAMFVLVIMNASSFKTVGGTVGSIWSTETSLLEGSGYKRAA